MESDQNLKDVSIQYTHITVVSYFFVLQSFEYHFELQHGFFEQIPQRVRNSIVCKIRLVANLKSSFLDYSCVDGVVYTLICQLCLHIVNLPSQMSLLLCWSLNISRVEYFVVKLILFFIREYLQIDVNPLTPL